MDRNSKSPSFGMAKESFIFGILIFNFFMLACTNSIKMETSSLYHFFIELGEEFVLKKGQGVRLAETGLEIKILNFFNQPCPPNMKCIWSGIGIEFEYRLNGQSKRGINLVKAFDYKIAIIKSDYESCAILKVDKDQ